ncbi:MAG: hypothetical protein KDA37_17655 [Planctomycetales bacterium]|nr:hypothetical protein [Planctomycetales bacterium]
MLEVALALMIVAGILQLTMPLLSHTMRREVAQASYEDLLRLAHGEQNRACHFARQKFAPFKDSGDFSSDDRPQLLWTVQCSSPQVDPQYRMAIQTFAWYDADRNGRFDAGEPSLDLWTCVARASN